MITLITIIPSVATTNMYTKVQESIETLSISSISLQVVVKFIHIEHGIRECRHN